MPQNVESTTGTLRQQHGITVLRSQGVEGATLDEELEEGLALGRVEGMEVSARDAQRLGLESQRNRDLVQCGARPRVSPAARGCVPKHLARLLLQQSVERPIDRRREA